MRKILIMLFALTFSMAVGAQNVDKLYKEGKALYDTKKYKEAFPKLKTAAEKGHKKAQYRLGRCYAKGRGTAKNTTLAFQWYSKSAAQGHAKAQYRLGKCYMKGKGTQVDQKKAVYWLKKSVSSSDKGSEILAELRADASQGDEDAKAILKMIGK